MLLHIEPMGGEPAGRPGVRAMVAATVRLYRDGLASSLGATMDVVAVTADGLAQGGALSLVRTLSDTVPATRVVMFAVDDAQDGQVLACVEAGAAGWVGRDASAAEVADAVRRAAHGELLCSARTAALLSRRVAALARERGAPPVLPCQLTPREAEIGDLLCRGMSNKQIARTLGLQPATVKNHVHNILEKLEVRSRAEVGDRLRRATIYV